MWRQLCCNIRFKDRSHPILTAYVERLSSVIPFKIISESEQQWRNEYERTRYEKWITNWIPQKRILILFIFCRFLFSFLYSIRSVERQTKPTIKKEISVRCRFLLFILSNLTIFLRFFVIFPLHRYFFVLFSSSRR